MTTVLDIAPALITLLAEEPTNTGPDFGKASPVGLLVVVLLLIGVFVLVWSMNRHLRRVPTSFAGTEAPESGVESGAAAEVTGGGDPPSGHRAVDTGESSRESGG